MKPRRKVAVVGIGYIAWQVIFPIIASPLVHGWLTFEQMGYTWKTAPMGLLVGAIVTILIYLFARTPAGPWLYVRGLSHIKTREELEFFWKVSLRGCDDGIIAETHWSGTVLPLLMMAFGSIGIPYPFNAIPAIFVRWGLHVGAHLMIPRGGAKERIFGGLGFFGIGLLISDTKNSICFLLSRNIVAPAMLHHLDGYASTWAGNKEKVAKMLGIQPIQQTKTDKA